MVGKSGSWVAPAHLCFCLIGIMHLTCFLVLPCRYPPKKPKSLARRNLVAPLVADLCFVIERLLVCCILSAFIQTRLFPELVFVVAGFCAACNLMHFANYSQLGDKRWEMKLRKEREEKEGWIKRYENLAEELSEARASMEVYRDPLHVRDF